MTTRTVVCFLRKKSGNKKTPLGYCAIRIQCPGQQNLATSVSSVGAYPAPSLPRSPLTAAQNTKQSVCQFENRTTKLCIQTIILNGKSNAHFLGRTRIGCYLCNCCKVRNLFWAVFVQLADFIRDRDVQVRRFSGAPRMPQRSFQWRPDRTHVRP